MTWTGGAGDGQWPTAGNWNPAGPPGLNDYACIPITAPTVTVSFNATLRGLDARGAGLVVNARLYLTDQTQSSTINNLTLNNGLGSDGTLTFTGNATWVSGSGSLFGLGTLINADIMTVTTNDIVNLFGHLINQGTFHAGLGNAPTLCIFDGAVFENSHLFDLGGFVVDGNGGTGATCGFGVGSGRLVNDPTASVQNNGQIKSLFDNHGVVALGGGSLKIDNGSSPGQTDNGTYVTTAGQGSIFFEGGTRNFAGVTITGGDGTGTGVYLIGGTLTGTINLLGNMYWGTTNQSGGSFQNATISGPGALHLTTNQMLLLTGNLTNQAVIDGQGHGFADSLCLLDGATFRNAGRVTLPPGGIRVCAGNRGTGLVRNEGQMISSLGTGGTSITAPFTNAGVLEVDSGIVSIEGTFNNYDPISRTLAGGTYFVNAGPSVVQSIIRFTNADVVNLAAEADISGSAAAINNQSDLSAFRDLSMIAPSGNLSLADHTLSDTVSLVNDGTLLLGPAATLNVGGTYIQAHTAQLTFSINGSPASGQFGRLAVTGNVTQDGVMNIQMPGPFAALGDEYPVMPYGLVSGTFATINGTAIDATKMFRLDYRAAALVLVVVQVGTGDAPVSASGKAVAAVEGSPFTGTVATFTDPDAAATPSEYTATISWGDGSTSPGLIAGAGGSFTVSGTHTYAEEGPYTVAVTVTDADLPTNTATATATATVADAGLAATATPVSATEGVAFGPVSVATFTDADPNGAATDYSATINWGDGSPSTTGTVSAGPSGGFAVSGSHTYAEEGTFTVTATIADAGGSNAVTTASATVSDAPLSAAGRALNGVEGVSFTGAVATFTDADPNGAASDYTATITWGDGTTSAGTVSPNGSGGFSVTGSHAYAEEGPYTVGVAVIDVGGSQASSTALATIADAPLSATGRAVSGIEGSSFSGVVATFIDADPGGVFSDYTATIGWGDGSTSTGTVSASASGGFVVSGSHTYAEEGSFNVAVTVADIGGSTATAVGSAKVADASLSAAAVAVTGAEGGSFSGVVATFTDADPAGTASDYTASINWGDGSTSTGTVIAGAAGAFAVSGSHAYAEEGTFNLTVTITDAGGSQATTSSQPAVADAALSAASVAISGVEGSSSSGVVATFTDADPNGAATDYTATINWGDGSTSSGTVSPDGSGGFAVTGSHTYAEEGSYTVGVSIADVGGSRALTNASASVADAPLSASAVAIAGVEGRSLSGVVATFTDADSNGMASDYTATISWGDGSTSTGTVSATASGGFAVSGSHTYAEEGSHSIAVQIADVGGSTVSVTGSASVSDAALSAKGTSFSVRRRTTFTRTIATFSDLDPNGTARDYHAVIDWGDGTTSVGTVVIAAGGGFRVVGRHRYLARGTMNVTVTISDTGGSVAVAHSTVTVTRGRR